MSYKKYAHELGYSQSYITLLRRLGRALVVHQVPPESPLFSALRNAAVRKEVGQLLDLDAPQSYELLSEAVEKSTPGAVVQRPSVSDPLRTLEDAIRAVTESIRHADRELLECLEERVGDLFFAVREARRSRSS
jgi:hypothetical protein